MLKTLCLISLLGLFIMTSAHAIETYYVDSISGNDTNDGRSPQAAWQTLRKVNSTKFEPGCRILLRSGSQFAGPLNLTGSGTEKQMNVVTRYGLGAKPKITVPIGVCPTLSVVNGEYWDVSSLELEGGNIGVFAWAKDFGPIRRLQFRDLYIHDAIGGLASDDGGFLCRREGEDTYFDGLLIDGCRIEHCDRNGILITDYPTASDKIKSVNVVIRNNRIRDIGGDGIFIINCEGAVIERNVLRYAHQRVGNAPGERACAGIWPHRSNNTLIQYNEVSHTAVGGKIIWDSEGFDDDISCRGTIFQYNYSHDNAGGFLLICGGARGTIVRYNISQNDGTAVFTMESDGSGDATIHNNTIYLSPDKNIPLLRNTFGSPDNIRFYNNIFYAEGGLQYGFNNTHEVSFSSNVYFKDHENLPEDTSALVSDPMLIAPGTGAEGLDSLGGYRLQENSPCIGTGIRLPDMGKHDFWGKPVSETETPSIGAGE